MIEHRAVAREGGFDLAREVAVLLRGGEALLAFGGIFVGLPPRDVEQMADQFGGLAHIESVIGSVRPRSRPMIGVKNDGRKPRNACELGADTARGKQLAHTRRRRDC